MAHRAGSCAEAAATSTSASTSPPRRTQRQRRCSWKISAALVGIALALSALVLHITTGSAVWDGAASLLIGLLLIVVAYLLMRRNLALLIDEAAPAEVRERLRLAVAQEPWVAEVAAVYIGPKQLLVLAHVVPVDGAELTACVGRPRRELLAVPAIAGVEVTPSSGAP